MLVPLQSFLLCHNDLTPRCGLSFQEIAVTEMNSLLKLSYLPKQKLLPQALKHQNVWFHSRALFYATLTSSLCGSLSIQEIAVTPTQFPLTLSFYSKQKLLPQTLKHQNVWFHFRALFYFVQLQTDRPGAVDAVRVLHGVRGGGAGVRGLALVRLLRRLLALDHRWTSGYHPGHFPRTTNQP